MERAKSPSARKDIRPPSSVSRLRASPLTWHFSCVLAYSARSIISEENEGILLVGVEVGKIHKDLVARHNSNSFVCSEVIYTSFQT